MKIKDILGEDDTIKSISGDSAVVNLAGKDTQVKTSDLMPGPNNSVSVKPPEHGEIRPGMTVNSGDTATPEDTGNDPQTAQLTQLMNQAREPWLRKFYAYRINYLKDQHSLAGEPGAGMGAPLDANGNLKPVEPDPVKWIKQNPSIVQDMPYDALPPGMKQPGMIDKIKGAFGMEEEHKDTIAQGGGEVGGPSHGDGTDAFINDVRDKDFEKYNKHESRSVSKSADDELLEKMRMIAGLR